MTVELMFDRRAPDNRFGMPKRLLAAMKESQRFFRNNKGQILFLVADRPQLQFVQLSRREELRGILEDADAIRIVCPHALNDDDYAGFWFAAHDYRWRLPFEGGYVPATAVRS